MPGTVLIATYMTRACPARTITSTAIQPTRAEISTRTGRRPRPTTPATAATAAYDHQLEADNPGTRAPVTIRAAVEDAQAASSRATSPDRTPRRRALLAGTGSQPSAGRMPGTGLVSDQVKSSSTWTLPFSTSTSNSAVTSSGIRRVTAPPPPTGRVTSPPWVNPFERASSQTAASPLESDLVRLEAHIGHRLGPLLRPPAGSRRRPRTATTALCVQSAGRARRAPHLYRMRCRGTLVVGAPTPVAGRQCSNDLATMMTTPRSPAPIPSIRAGRRGVCAWRAPR